MSTTELKHIEDMLSKHVSSMSNRLRQRRTITEEEFASYVESGEEVYDTLHKYYLSIASGKTPQEPGTSDTQTGSGQTTGQSGKQADGNGSGHTKANTTPASKRKPTK